TDDCGNSASVDFTLTVEDLEAPVFAGVLPADLNIACGSVPAPATLGATDNCDAAPSVTFNETSTPGNCAQTYTLTRTWTATDCSGNSTSHTQTLQVGDDEAPEITAEVYLEVACDVFDADLAYATASDNCDAGVTLTFSTLPFAGGCVKPIGMFTRMYTATDACGNTTQFEQIIALIDEVAPVFTSVPADMSVLCDEEIPVVMPEAWDNCDNAVVVTYVDQYVTGPMGMGSFLQRTFTAEDDCGNTATAVQTIEILDLEAPVFAPAADLNMTWDAWAATSVWNLFPAVTDNCDPQPMLGYVANNLSEDCIGSFVVEIQFTATDAAGNTSTAVRVVTVTDAVAPVFEALPSIIELECSEPMIPAGIGVTDNATPENLIDLTWTENVIPGQCDSEYTVIRFYTAIDDCGNTTGFLQTIKVSDTQAPVLEGTCDFTNGQSVNLCYDDVLGGMTVPDPCLFTAVDNCDAAVDVVYTETIESVYGAPSGEVAGYCAALDPAPVDGEMTCDDFTPHSLRLFNFPGGEFYQSVEGVVTNLANGGWTLTQTLVSETNPTAGWTLQVTYGPGYTWEEWVALPGPQGYKFDCGDQIDDHENWMYHVMQTGTLVGWGGFEGSSLALSHQPANLYFGLQVGTGANNKNSQHGYSGWFFYNGQFNGSTINGSGDLFGDLDCTLPTSIVRTWTATDCSGNATTFSYTLNYDGFPCGLFAPPMGKGDDLSGAEGSEGTGSVEEPVPGKLPEGLSVVSMKPNPVIDRAEMMYVSAEDTEILVEIYMPSGQLVQHVFRGQVQAATVQSLTVSTLGLREGLYHMRILSEFDQKIVRFVVSD
ncbi:MAG: hypothetical protein RJA19_1484, partial [Bacteroidota bacterium]